MKYLVLYGLFLFVGLPVIMTSVHLSTLDEPERRELSEGVRDLNRRIYTARIICDGQPDHVMKVSGRTRESARRRLQDQLQRCNVVLEPGQSAPIWQEAIRPTY